MDHGGDVWLAEGTPIILKHYLDDESFFRRFYLVDPQGQMALQGSYTEFIPLNFESLKIRIAAYFMERG